MPQHRMVIDDEDLPAFLFLQSGCRAAMIMIMGIARV